MGAKLRGVGPMTTASGAYCIGGARDAAVVWAGGFTFRLEFEDVSRVGVRAPFSSKKRVGPSIR